MPISEATLAAAYADISALNSVIATEEQPLVAVQDERVAVDIASTNVSDLATKLSALSTAADALADPQAFRTWSATSDSAAVVAAMATANGTPTAGTLSVAVAQLATAQITRSSSMASSTQPMVMSGALGIAVGATSTTVTVDPSDSLADLANKINASGAKVVASVIFEDDAYKLEVRGRDTGEDNAVTFSRVGERTAQGTHSIASLGLTRPDHTIATANNALLTVDGITMSRASNLVTDAKPGVNLALTQLTTAPATITVESESVLQANITTFVDAYNDVLTSGRAAIAQASAVPTLASDSSVETTIAQVASLSTAVVPGVLAQYATLASVGIESDETGLLHLDAAKLLAAIGDDRTSVRHLLVSEGGDFGAIAGFHELVSQVAGTPSSLVQSRLAGLSTQSQRLETNASTIEARVDSYRTMLSELLASLAAQTEP